MEKKQVKKKQKNKLKKKKQIQQNGFKNLK